MNRLIASIVVVATTASAAAEAGDIVVTLRDRAVVSGNQVRVGDIASVRGGDAALQERAARVPVGPSPRLDGRRTFARQDVKLALARAGLLADVVAAGAGVAVERPSTSLLGTRLAEVARDHLVDHLQRTRPDLTRIEVTTATTLESLRIPVGATRLVPRDIGGDKLAKRVCVWVDIEVGGATVRSVPIWFAVEAYRPVVLVKRAYDAKETLRESDVALEERDVAGLRLTLLDTIEQVRHLRTKRALVAGSTLVTSDVEALPPVVAETEVAVHVNTGVIAIDTRAIAIEDGSVGDVIRVRNPESALIYSARVVAAGRAVAMEN